MKCPECNSKEIITDFRRGESYCSKCGYVIIEQLVDQSPSFNFKSSSP